MVEGVGGGRLVLEVALVWVNEYYVSASTPLRQLDLPWVFQRSVASLVRFS